MSNLIQRTTELAMHIIGSYVRPGDIVIDATCGGGHDTLRLARMAPETLYAFDIQPEAIEQTRTLLRQEGFPAEIRDERSSAPDSAGRCAEHPAILLTCLSHEHLAEFFRGSENFASAIVFNLGYLPGGDKTRTTRTDTTLAAVRASLTLLKRDGLLCLTMYSGHPEGAEEKRALLAFAEELDPKQWHVCYLSMPNQKNHPPEILLISRKK